MLQPVCARPAEKARSWGLRQHPMCPIHFRWEETYAIRPPHCLAHARPTMCYICLVINTVSLFSVNLCSQWTDMGILPTSSGKCCDEGKSFLEEVPDSPAAKAYSDIIKSEVPGHCLYFGLLMFSPCFMCMQRSPSIVPRAQRMRLLNDDVMGFVLIIPSWLCLVFVWYLHCTYLGTLRAKLSVKSSDVKSITKFR